MRFATVLALSLGGASLAAAQQTAPASAPAAGPTKQLQPADLKAWKTIRQSVLSNDGKWFAYVLAPNEGDANVIIRSTGDDNKEWKFPIGSSDAGGRGGGGGGRGGAAPDAGGGPLSISADSRWVAFTGLSAIDHGSRWPTPVVRVVAAEAAAARQRRTRRRKRRRRRTSSQS